MSPAGVRSVMASGVMALVANTAFTEWSALMFSTHDMPVQSPCQPVKVESVSGAALSVRLVTVAA